MRIFRLLHDLARGETATESGFGAGVRREGKSRFAIQQKFQHGDRIFYAYGRSFSFTEEQELENWFGRFDSNAIGAWAKQADGDLIVIVIDKAKSEVYLVSDRNGTTRAYYATQRGSVIIANSRHQMAALLNSPKISSYDAYTLLTLGYILDPNSLIADASVTMPGTVVTFRKSGMSASCYYDPVNIQTEYFGSEQECVRKLEQSFCQVFEKRLTQGRTPCVLLSGGIDSVAMLKYVKQLHSGRVTTLTHSVQGLYPNELEPARIAARHFGTDHHELLIDPGAAAANYVRVLMDADTSNFSSIQNLATRDYLERLGGLFDVFTGEDTRLHTPSFDSPREIGLFVHRHADVEIARWCAAAAAGLLRLWPGRGPLKNYLNYWVGNLTLREDLKTYILKVMLGFRFPPDGRYTTGKLHERLRAETPDYPPELGLQELYKRHVAFEYRLQYTDDMQCGVSSMTGDSTELHHPFYDWQFVETANRVSYSIGMRPIYTFRTWNKMPVVRKRILRLTVKDAVPKEILYRAKKTCPSLHLLFNSSIGGVVSTILDRWGGALMEALDPEAGEIAQGYINSYRCRTEFHLNQDEDLLWGVLVVCYLATLHQTCLNRSFDLDGELRASQTLAAGWR